jgi:HEAT repeat protein
MEGKFFGKEVASRPRCPFCGLVIGKPRDLTQSEMPMGTCTCGAVYAFDVTGHNLGSAMIEALVYACGGDWDCAWSLSSGEDYLDEQVYNYDDQTHRIIYGGVYEGRRISGTLYFIKVRKDFSKTKTEETTPQRPAPEKAAAKERRRKSFAKHDVEAFVKAYELDTLLAMAEEDKRIIRDLKRLLYSADDTLRWRAAEALGRVSAVIAEKDPGTIGKLLQGLFSSLMDTAASSWGAMDAIGEIISQNPEPFSGYIPQLYQMAQERTLLAGVLRALGKIGRATPEPVRRTAHYFIPLLNDSDPAVRGHAAILLGHLGTTEARDDLIRLLDDSSELPIYEAGEVVTKTVGELCADTLEKL